MSIFEIIDVYNKLLHPLITLKNLYFNFNNNKKNSHSAYFKVQLACFLYNWLCSRSVHKFSWSIFSWASNSKMLLKERLGYSLTCTTTEFIHKACQRWVFRKLRAMKMSTDIRYTYFYQLCTHSHNNMVATTLIKTTESILLVTPHLQRAGNNKQFMRKIGKEMEFGRILYLSFGSGAWVKILWKSGPGSGVIFHFWQ